MSQKFCHRSGSPEPHVKCPSLGAWQQEEVPPQNLALKTSRVWLLGFHRTGGNRSEAPLLEGTHKVVCTPGPRRKKQWPRKRLDQTYLLVLEGVLERRGELWLTAGTNTLVTPASTHWHEDTQRLPCKMAWKGVGTNDRLRNWKRLDVVGVQVEGQWLQQGRWCVLNLRVMGALEGCLSSARYGGWTGLTWLNHVQS